MGAVFEMGAHLLCKKSRGIDKAAALLLKQGIAIMMHRYSLSGAAAAGQEKRMPSGKGWRDGTQRPERTK